MFRFEKFDVWHKAIEYANAVYLATAKFPSDERFGLTSQMRRASVSISPNIAEGSSRRSDVEFARYLDIAYGSLMETVSQAVIANQQAFLSNDALHELRASAEQLARMLSGLKSKMSK